jgi:hypothetical protein
METNYPDSPLTFLNPADPGDDVQRRFRYQHGYGVVLLVSALIKELPFRAIWCEHHEDLLAERTDGLFEGFQIKTQKPELGAWECKDAAFKKSLNRFVQQDTDYPGSYCAFHFVSNADFAEGKNAADAANSPIRLVKAIHAAASLEALKKSHPKFFDYLKSLGEEFGQEPDAFFAVLKKVQLNKFASLEDFDACLAHEVLPKVPLLEKLESKELDAARDELIGLIFRASSIAVTDPARFLENVAAANGSQTELLRKRITPDEARVALSRWKAPTFRFAPAPDAMKLRDVPGQHEVLEKKMNRGGLDKFMVPMQRRTLSAERFLLEMSHSSPEATKALLNQLDGAIVSDCSDAQLVASEKPEPYGEAMLRLIHKSLKERAEEKPDTVGGLDYDCLVGVAGMLTNECKIWWSEKFDLSESA